MNESTNYIIRPLQAGENHLLRNFLSFIFILFY